MKKLIALAAILATAGTAYADDHGGDGKFSHNAEYRVRYQYDQNITGDKDTAPSSQDNIVHRFKFGTTFKASEKLSATLTLLHNASWGSNDLGGTTATGHSPTGDAKGVQTGTNDAQNMLLVHEAYGNWVVSDSFNLKFGRGNAGLADGALIGENDWQATPYAYEGILGTYEHESFQLQVWGVRFAEWARSVSANHDDDPEANSFGLAFDFKSLPEFLNLVNIHVLQNNNDEIYNSANATIVAKAAIMRYGLAIGGETAGLDYKVNYEAESGETENSGTKTDKETMMYQIELGYSMPEVMNSRFYAAYHMDSGTGSGATKNETYDPYFYELHANAGLMDVVKWGNLTYISVGYTLEPMEDTMVGIHYHMFSRTENNRGIDAGANGGSMGLGGTANNIAGNTKDKIGDEIDLTATKNYGDGFSVTTRAGMFMPGDYLKDTTINKKDTYTQVFVEAKMMF